VAIAIKGISATELIELLKLGEAKQAWLAANGVSIQVGATEIKLIKPGVAGVAFPVKLAHLTALKSGQLGTLAKQSMAIQLRTLVTKMQEVLQNHGAAATEETMPSGAMSALTGYLSDLKAKVHEAVQPVVVGVDLAEPSTDTAVWGVAQPTTPQPVSATIKAGLDVTKAAPAFKPPAEKFTPKPSLPSLTLDQIVEKTVGVQAAAQPAWPQFALGKMSTAPQVKLRDATMMYQPVHGSSAASRYFVVGANKDIRVAARWKGSALSIRIEGPGLDQHVGSIKACGFDNVNQGKAYASLHLEVGRRTRCWRPRRWGRFFWAWGCRWRRPSPGWS